MRDKSAREPSRSLYRYLETAFDSGEFVVRESGTACSAGVILHAVDASGKRVLLIPVSEEEFEGFVDDAAGTAVVLRKERYSSGQGSVDPYLVFRCETNALRNTFASFVDDVLDEFEASVSTNSTSATAITVLQKWRRLFARRGSGLVDDKSLIGLAAELRVLQKLLSLKGLSAFGAWTGPDGADHDLVFSDCAIEVKATSKKAGLELQINSVGQLDAPSFGPLYLAAVRVAFSPNGAITVPALVDSIIDAGVDRSEFSRKLEAVGYHHARAEEYEKKRIDFLEDRFFEIVDDFPRIDRSTLANIPQSDRILQVNYLLDLTDHETVAGSISATDLDTFLREFV
ncbi:PD-(D/E)XK motif protein [Dietzia cercidiphylli]|uniref:PD-(D/E)XK motif protein n=1 Tax=Dietzia cercidiphylli TaxID=498199 RepID=UPI00223AA6C2|nr:PD-(D/E)XK motif protein [Dietzia cercidiphylli]MCT1515627.1 PD-(D/E)XK motif protein [Dietzia cercidiphylli]